MRTLVAFLSLAIPLLAEDGVPGPEGAPRAGGDTCLMLAARCIAKGSGNFYLYYKVSDRRVTFAEGDRLEYDVFLDPHCPIAKGGVDAQLEGGGDIRDSNAVDEEGLRAHGNAILDKAKGAWLHRAIDLSCLAGRTAERWDLVFEGDPPGLYVQFVDNLVVERADGSRETIWAEGDPPKDEIDWKEGYSKETRLAAVPRSKVAVGEAYRAFVESELRSLKLVAIADEHAREVDYLLELLRREGRDDLAKEVEEARASLPDARTFQGSAEDFLAALHEADHRLAHAHPVMQQYTGHLVGHAHIDFQWLWEWPETIEVCKQTFGQATRFMKEFPGFTFSQSSAALYLAMEEKDPPLFRRIHDFVEKGQWEIVGGRWCEGDTNTVSGESHARHFLYAQRYFREKFGRTAKVGWEPDTFGHSWAMPQMLRQAGIDTYYFCRGGKGKPLFWWEGPDGSRVLAFEEPAIKGGWYNSDLGPRQLQEMIEFRDATGSREMLWVYGVGNHGGGPTRENILTALGWQGKTLPNARFSTAGAFFDAVKAKCDLSKLPVVRDELNPVFEGTYTTHSDMKRWNRDLETLAVQAETAAAIASRLGYAYPREAFLRTWRDLLWNHHHDTLPGTSIHASYALSRRMCEESLATTRRVLDDATRTIAGNVKDAHEGDLFVLNTLGWRRDAVVRAKAREGLSGPLCAVSPSGDRAPIQRSTAGELVFVARGLPPFGYGVYRIEAASETPTGAHVEGNRIATADLEVEIDAATGTILHLVHGGREVLSHPGNLIEVAWEAPHGGSAWTIGEIRGVDPPGKREPFRLVENGPVYASFRGALGYGKSRIEATITVVLGLPEVEFALDVDWRERGTKGRGGPFLRTTFPFSVEGVRARYAIPFGEIERPMDGRECAALAWADVSGPRGGAALLNDCKHGHSARGGALTLSLIRSSYEPDPVPDVGLHHIRYAVLPHGGGPDEARVPFAAFEFNTPPMAVWTKAGEGDLPLERSFLAVDGALATALKLSEDGDDWVVRFTNPAAAAATASVPCVAKALEVNFVEDVLSEIDPAKVPLRGYEVKTLRLAR